MTQGFSTARKGAACSHPGFCLGSSGARGSAQRWGMDRALTFSYFLTSGLLSLTPNRSAVGAAIEQRMGRGKGVPLMRRVEENEWMMGAETAAIPPSQLLGT